MQQRTETPKNLKKNLDLEDLSHVREPPARNEPNGSFFANLFIFTYLFMNYD